MQATFVADSRRLEDYVRTSLSQFGLSVQPSHPSLARSSDEPRPTGSVVVLTMGPSKDDDVSQLDIPLDSVVVVVSVTESQTVERLIAAAQRPFAVIEAVFDWHPSSRLQPLWVGGKEEHVDTYRPLLEALSDDVHYVGAIGTPVVVAALSRAIYAGALLATVEALEVGRRAGIPRGVALAAFNMSSGRSGASEMLRDSATDPHAAASTDAPALEGLGWVLPAAISIAHGAGMRVPMFERVESAIALVSPADKSEGGHGGADDHGVDVMPTRMLG